MKVTFDVLGRPMRFVTNAAYGAALVHDREFGILVSSSTVVDDVQRVLAFVRRDGDAVACTIPIPDEIRGQGVTLAAARGEHVHHVVRCLRASLAGSESSFYPALSVDYFSTDSFELGIALDSRAVLLRDVPRYGKQKLVVPWDETAVHLRIGDGTAECGWINTSGAPPPSLGRLAAARFNRKETNAALKPFRAGAAENAALHGCGFARDEVARAVEARVADILGCEGPRAITFAQRCSDEAMYCYGLVSGKKVASGKDIGVAIHSCASTFMEETRHSREMAFDVLYRRGIVRPCETVDAMVRHLYEW